MDRDGPAELDRHFEQRYLYEFRILASVGNRVYDQDWHLEIGCGRRVIFILGRRRPTFGEIVRQNLCICSVIFQ